MFNLKISYPYFIMALSAAFWGGGTVLSKYLLSTLPPTSLLLLQLTFSTMFLWSIILIRKDYRKISRKDFKLGLSGVFEPGLAYLFTQVGLRYTSASSSSIIFTLEQIFVIILAAVFLGESLGRRVLICTFLALIGTYFTLDLSSNSTSNLSGDLLILTGVFCASCYVVWSKSQIASQEVLILATLQQTAGLIFVLLVWPIFLIAFDEAAELSSFILLDQRQFIIIILLAALSGIVQYALSILFYLSAIKKIQASVAILFLNLIPVFVISGSYVFLGEKLGFLQSLGVGIILISILLLTRTKGVSAHTAK